MSAAPKLREDLVIVEQRYRGQQTYIVKDPVTHKYFRFKPLEVMVMQQFTGEHGAAELAAGLAEQGLPISAAAIDSFARKLRQMDLLVRSVAEKSVLLMERLRAERRRRVKRTHYAGSLLRMRWSVGDPNRLFDTWLPRLRFLFTPWSLWVSIALFAVYLAVFVTHFHQIIAGVEAMYTPQFYTLRNIVLFWGTGMIVIAIHELGHGFACKYYGGQVHEMGAMLIYFQPAFYCNVNDAWTFPELRARLWVTAAGSWVQVVVAALAAIVWLLVQPGTVIWQITFFAVLIGGATTVLANANPLIPLDGYYALSDYLEIPNLRQRASAHLGWWVRRHVLRLDVPEPPADEREHRVFVIYGVLATVYITMILGIVGLFALRWTARAFGLLGGLVALVAIWMALRTTLRSWGRAAVTAVKEHRTFWESRTLWSRVGIGAALLLLLLVLVPWPLTVSGAFQAAPALMVPLATPDSGVVAQVFVPEGASVAAGTPILRIRSYVLESAAAGAARQADSLSDLAQAARAAGRIGDARDFELLRDEARARQQGFQDRIAALTLRAPFTGVITTPRLTETVGLAVSAGQVIAREAAMDSVQIRIMLGPAGAGDVKAGQPVSLIADVGERPTYGGTVSSIVPAAAAGQVEARLLLPRTRALRPGVGGEARVTVRRSNLLGALWWGVRKRVRNDLLL